MRHPCTMCDKTFVAASSLKENGETVRTLKKDRYKQLEHVIRTHVSSRDMEVLYMYYSTQDGVPCVMSDFDYVDSFKEFVLV